MPNDGPSSPPSELSSDEDSGDEVKVTEDREDTETQLDPYEPRPIDPGSREFYEKACELFKVIPASAVLNRLEEASINLSNYGITTKGVKAFCVTLVANVYVTTLILDGNKFEEVAVDMLVDMLRENELIVHLSMNRTGMGVKGVIALSRLLLERRNMTVLSIADNGLRDADIEELCAAIEDHPSLVRLNLSKNKLGENGAQILSRTIAENSKLEDIDLSWNHFRGASAAEICKSLGENNSLLKAYLGWNGLDDGHGILLGEALKKNVRLQELHLEGNRISDKGFICLCMGLKGNETLKKLIVGQNPISNGKMDDVFDLKKESGKKAPKFIPVEIGKEMNANGTISAMLMFIATIENSALTILDLNGVHCDPVKFDAKLKEVQAIKADFKSFCNEKSYRFLKKKRYNPAEEAIQFIRKYVQEKNVSLAELFSELDSDGSMSVDYDEFRQGLKKAKIPLTALQVDYLIDYLDKDKDGEIDFSELVIGEEEVTRRINERMEQEPDSD